METRKSSIFAKIMLLGDAGVGKTTLGQIYTDFRFSTDSFLSFGVAFGVKEDECDGKRVKFQIWELAGNTRFDSIRNVYYAGTMGAVLVYDVTRPNTQHNLIRWIDELYTYSHGINLPLVIVGNKIDIREASHHVTREQGLRYIEQFKERYNQRNIDFIETSAVTRENIYKAFYLLARNLLSWLPERKLAKQLNLSSLKHIKNLFCPFCGDFRLITGREKQGGQERIYCP
ncbi:MAG: GTP-binding protein, partial [Promethearchaeota archaeon]